MHLLVHLQRLGTTRGRAEQDHKSVLEGALPGRSPQSELAIVFVRGGHGISPFTFTGIHTS